MPEYIERGAAKYAVDLAVDLTDTEYDMICNQIDRLPAADVAPVKHARWNGYYLDWPWTLFKMKSPYSFCTNCACAIKAKKITKYCPTCGAKMDLEAGG